MLWKELTGNIVVLWNIQLPGVMAACGRSDYLPYLYLRCLGTVAVAMLAVRSRNCLTCSWSYMYMYLGKLLVAYLQ